VSAYALADKEGSRTYYLHQDDSMNSLVESSSQVLRDEFPFDNPDLVSQTKIDTCRLDQFVETHRLADRWFMIKIDTQGNELEILKHGTKTLARTEACVVEFMFLTPYRMSYNFADLVTFMDGHGFVCQGALTIARRPSQRISAVDFLFVRHL
jgi:FkbM family methyltransferase